MGAKPGDEARWRKFMAATVGQPPWPGLVRAADMFETPGEALDVGAGAGRDTAYLLSRGWRVTALDSSPSAAEALERLPHSNLRVVVAAGRILLPLTTTWSTPSSRCRSSHASISKRRSGVSVTRYGAAASWRRRSSESAMRGMSPRTT